MATQVRHTCRPLADLLTAVSCHNSMQDNDSCRANKQRLAGVLSLLKPKQYSLHPHGCSFTHSATLPMQAPAPLCYATSTFMIACTS